MHSVCMHSRSGARHGCYIPQGTSIEVCSISNLKLNDLNTRYAEHGSCFASFTAWLPSLTTRCFAFMGGFPPQLVHWIR